MNQLIIKRASIFSLILGAVLGLIALFPFAIGFVIFLLGFLSSVAIILYMKKNEKHLGIIDNEQGAILGGIIGFCSGVGFFVSFAPMVSILKLIFKDYYAYAIPYVLEEAFWLFLVIVFIVAFIFALTNSATGMATAFLLNKFEEKPKVYDAPLDNKIED